MTKQKFMERARLHIMTLLIPCFIMTSSCSQVTSTSTPYAINSFVGSTPCDSFIKVSLGIPADTKCDFIKWTLRLHKAQQDSDTFQMTALYGEGQPNTNGFIGGGKQIAATGNYIINYGAPANPNMRIYYLNGNNLPSSFLLLELDSNILHFADNDKRLLVGNGGWSYVLNRIQQ